MIVGRLQFISIFILDENSECLPPPTDICVYTARLQATLSI